MTSLLNLMGIVVAAVLLGLLVLTLHRRSLRFWPTPGAGSWQSYVFWPLFRGLNALCFAIAALEVWQRGGEGHLSLPVWLRVVALALLMLSVALFVYAFKVLGRDNNYGAQQGLVTSGIYCWSRNPQNAMLIVVYASLAIAADSGRAYLLCAAMILVYTLMVLAEEPWLVESYGEAYQSYCQRVPRFFNFGAVRQWLSRNRDQAG